MASSRYGSNGDTSPTMRRITWKDDMPEPAHPFSAAVLATGRPA